jgi:hypothetical protein
MRMYRIGRGVQNILERICLQHDFQNFKISAKKEEFGKTFGMMEKFCFVIALSDLIGANTRKYYDDESLMCFCCVK